MAYSDDIAALNPDHHWKFDGDSLDAIGSANGTDTSVSHTGTPLCEDATNSALLNAVGDRISIPTTTTINNAAHARKALGGWAMVTQIMTQPKRIMGEGNATTAYQIVLAYGNETMFEVIEPTNFDIQIIADSIMKANREYHFFTRFSGNGYDNVADYFVDGVKVLSTPLADRQPDNASIDSRTVLEFGDPAGTVGIGGSSLVMNCPTNLNLNHWYAWGDSANAELTDTEIREELFEKGASPDITISTGTEGAMQTSLDAYADTVRGDYPLCIRINDVTGSGDLDLDADNITFDSLASIHVQWMGTGELTWTNLNGSDASIFSTPNDGTVSIINPAKLTIEGLINGCEIRIYENETPSDGSYNTELAGTEILSGTSYEYDHAGVANDIIVQMIATGYIEIVQNFSLIAADQTLTVFPQVEENT